MSKTLFMFSTVLFLASMGECRACVPEITCFDDYDDQIETNNSNTITATNTNDDNNEMGKRCKATWVCTFAYCAPRTNCIKKFSILKGFDRFERRFQMTRDVGTKKSIFEISQTTTPSCSEVGCDSVRTVVSVQTADASETFESKECEVQETAKRCDFGDIPANDKVDEVFSEITAQLMCKNYAMPCSSNEVRVDIDFFASVDSVPEPPSMPNEPNEPMKPPLPPSPPSPPGAFEPGGYANVFLIRFGKIALVVFAVYLSLGYALALAISRGKWHGFTEACGRDGKGRNACSLLFMWCFPFFWRDASATCLDAYYDDEENVQARLLDSSDEEDDAFKEDDEIESGLANVKVDSDNTSNSE